MLIDLMYCQVRRKLSPILRDAGSSLDLAAFSAISLGLIYVGSGNNNASQDIVAASMFRSELELGDPLTGFLHLGLGLLYLGKQVTEVINSNVSLIIVYSLPSLQIKIFPSFLYGPVWLP